MPVNPVEDVTQVTPVQNDAEPQTSPAASQQNKPSVPVDEVNVSPQAAALVAEQQALKNANNGLSPAAEEIQTEQRLAAAAATGRPGSSQTTPASLWKSALTLTND